MSASNRWVYNRVWCSLGSFALLFPQDQLGLPLAQRLKKLGSSEGKVKGGKADYHNYCFWINTRWILEPSVLMLDFKGRSNAATPWEAAGNPSASSFCKHLGFDGIYKYGYSNRGRFLLPSFETCGEYSVWAMLGHPFLPKEMVQPQLIPCTQVLYTLGDLVTKKYGSSILWAVFQMSKLQDFVEEIPFVNISNPHNCHKSAFFLSAESW